MRLETPWVLLLSFAVAALWGCNSNSSPATPDADFFVREGQAFRLRFGETAGVQTVTTVVLVRFNDVLGDTRCPEGATCDAPGHATVEVAVQTSLAINDIQAEIPPVGRVETVVEEVTVEFIQLLPAALTDTEISLLDYELGIRVTQTGDIGIPQ